MLLRGWLINDALHGHFPGRVLSVMKAHWGSSPILRSALRRGKASRLTGLVSSRPIAWGRRPRLLWLLLTSVRYSSCCHAERSPKYLGRQSGQISPDKNVNCRYTTAAFTISPESVELRHVVLTCPDDGLVCCFCSSAHSFALRLPPDPSSRRRPCLRLVLGLPCLATVTGF